MSATSNSTITLTFCDVSENHKGMKKYGQIADRGYTYEELLAFKDRFENADIIKIECDEEVKDSNGDLVHFEDAWILVIRDGVNQLGDSNYLLAEMEDLEFDKKAWMKGKVMNKLARWNLCFADIEKSTEPKYENKEGRVIAYNDKKVEVLKEFKDSLEEILCEEDLTCELNMYYDIRKCGIDFHGDGERKKVIAVRLGATFPLYYQWYHDSKPVGTRYKFVLEHGDMYIMSAKAVGYDWLKKKIPTLRHMAGMSKKYIGDE